MESQRIQSVEQKTSQELRQERQTQRYLNKSSSIATKYLRRLKELHGVPHTFTFFEKILDSIFVKNKDYSKKESQKTVGTFCAMVPEELIYAAGGIPIKLCSGSYTSYTLGDELVPRDACPLVKSVIGFQASGCVPIYNNCSLMVVPTTCDCKKKMASLLAEFGEVATLHVPTIRKEDEIVGEYVKELQYVAKKVEEVTGNEITRERLETAIIEMGELQQELSRFYEHKKRIPSVIRGSHAMAIMNAYSYEEAERFRMVLRLLNEELDMRVQQNSFVARKNTPRIMLTGSPIAFPNIKLPLLIEEMGGILVADETCMGERASYDPVAVNDWSMEGMYRALARRYLLPCSCPTFANNSQRIYKLKQMIKEYQVDGVVYHVLRSCVVYDYEVNQVEESLSELGIPMIRVESDYNEEDIEQLRIRIEAFIEMIKFRKLAEEKRKIMEKARKENR